MKNTYIWGVVLVVVILIILAFSGVFSDKNTGTSIPVVDENKPQAKIDARVACESALAYMTFPSGEEADIFVTDCIDGKHPDVIERYISDMGLDGATI